MTAILIIARLLAAPVLPDPAADPGKFLLAALIREPASLSLEPGSALDLAALPTAATLLPPIGTHTAGLTYNVQPFTKNTHLGDDLNGIGGLDSDLGDPIHPVGPGQVILAKPIPGTLWGNVVIVRHARLEPPDKPDSPSRRVWFESFYGHLDRIAVQPGQNVDSSTLLGTVGKGGGAGFPAHLHLEIRDFTAPHTGPGYREDTTGWANPEKLILRLAPPEWRP